MIDPDEDPDPDVDGDFVLRVAAATIVISCALLVAGLCAYALVRTFQTLL